MRVFDGAINGAEAKWFLWRGDNALRKHLDKQTAIEETLLRWPKWSDRKVAGCCGTSHPTVAQVRARLEADGQLERLSSREGQDGRRRPARAAVKAARKKRPAAAKRKPPKEAPTASAPEPEQPEDPGAPDAIAEWERAERECEHLRSVIAAIEADDLRREVAKLADRYARLEGRLRQEMKTRTEAEKDARYAKVT